MGIIHWDIKHDNILLRTGDAGKCNSFVLIDYGFAMKLNRDED